LEYPEVNVENMGLD